MTQDGGRALWGRRTLLRTLGLTATTVALAGCASLTDRAFVADPVVLPAAAQSSLGFSSVAEESRRRTVEQTVGGRDVTATVESFRSVYARTGGETSAGGPSAPLLLRFCGASSDRLLAAPATAFGTVGGTLPVLRDGVVNPRGVVLFAPERALSDTGLAAHRVLAVVHRSAVSADRFVAAAGGVSVPGSAFFPRAAFDVDAGWFPDQGWTPPDGEAGSTVAVFSEAGVESGGTGTHPFDAGAPLDATYVAAPADVFFDAGVSVADSERARTVLGTDVRGLDAAGPDGRIADAGVVVFADRERGVPFAYVPGETLFPESTFVPDALFATGGQVLAASLGDLFRDQTFFPDGAPLSESLLNPESLALFFPAEPLSPVPDPFTVVDSDADLSPRGVLVFLPTAPAAVGGADTTGVPESPFYPSGVYAPPSLSWPDSVFWPDGPLFPDDVALSMATNGHPVTRTDLPASFPRSVFGPDGTFSPTGVLHLPGDVGFSPGLFESAGTTVTDTRSAAAGTQRGAAPATAHLGLAVLSTPVARVAGQSLDTLATVGLSALTTDVRAEPFLVSAGVGDGGIEWARGPTRVGSGTTTMLGDSVAMETHAGVLAGADPSAVYLHLARVESGGNVVLSAGVHGSTVADPDRPFVGADGYLSRDRLDRYRATIAAADEALVVR